MCRCCSLLHLSTKLSLTYVRIRVSAKPILSDILYIIVMMSSDSDCDADWDWDRHCCRQCLRIKCMRTDRRRARSKANIDELQVCVEDLRDVARDRNHKNIEEVSKHNSEQVKCPLCEAVVSRSALSCLQARSSITRYFYCGRMRKPSLQALNE